MATHPSVSPVCVCPCTDVLLLPSEGGASLSAPQISMPHGTCFGHGGICKQHEQNLAKCFCMGARPLAALGSLPHLGADKHGPACWVLRDTQPCCHVAPTKSQPTLEGRTAWLTVGTCPAEPSPNCQPKLPWEVIVSKSPDFTASSCL